NRSRNCGKSVDRAASPKRNLGSDRAQQRRTNADASVDTGSPLRLAVPPVLSAVVDRAVLALFPPGAAAGDESTACVSCLTASLRALTVSNTPASKAGIVGPGSAPAVVVLWLTSR